MNVQEKRFIKEYGPVYDTIARLDVDQELREEIAERFADALSPPQRDKFVLLASDPLCECAGPSDGEPCPHGREIRVPMHNRNAPDGRSAAWAQEKPEVRCVSCGSAYFLERGRA